MDETHVLPRKLLLRVKAYIQQLLHGDIRLATYDQISMGRRQKLLFPFKTNSLNANGKERNQVFLFLFFLFFFLFTLSPSLSFHQHLVQL